MKLHTLKRSKGIVSKAKRLGRGNGSGKGNYSTKGLKGQKARSGSGIKPFFEGGQTSIVQRIPKARGFTRYYKLVKDVAIVNLGALDMDDRITDGMEITKVLLKTLGYIKNAAGLVKLLGNGEWTKKVTFVDMDRISATAQKKLDNPSAPTATKKTTKIDKTPVEKKAPAKKAVAKAAPAKEVEAKKPAAKVAVEKKAPAKKPAAAKAAPAKKTTTKKDAKSK